MCDPNILAPLFEAVPLLLCFECGLSAPLAVEPSAVRLLEPLLRRVLGLEEEGHAEHGEAQRTLGVDRRLLHLADGVLEVAFANVAVGSHGVRDQLDRHTQPTPRRRRQPARPGE